MPSEPCSERIFLSKIVVDAIAQSQRVNAEYDAAKLTRSASVRELAIALQEARSVERYASHILADHIREHDCSPSKDPMAV